MYDARLQDDARDGHGLESQPARQVRGMFASIDAADWDALAERFDPEVVYERPGYPEFVGRERVLDFYRNERIVVSGRHEIEGVVVEGDTGASWGRMRGTLSDGSQADVRFAEVYSFARARIRTRRSYFFRAAV
jgi:ketosteroid isomerase-like protein